MSGFATGGRGQRSFQQSETFRGPVVFADEPNVGAFGRGDKFLREKGHIFVFENAFIILVVNAFIASERAGGDGINLFAGRWVEDFTTMQEGVRASNLVHIIESIGAHAIELIVFAIGRAGDATKVIGLRGENRFGGAPDGGGILMEGKFVEDEIAGETAGGAGIGGENFDTTDFAGDANACFAVHGFVAFIGAEVLLLESQGELVADLGATKVEFDSVDF